MKCVVLVVCVSLLYSALYQVVMPVIYQSENTVLFYGAVLVLALFTGWVTMMIIAYPVSIKREETMQVKKRMMVPYSITFGSMMLCLLVLGIVSFRFAMQVEQGWMAYAVNALLILACLLYVPVGVFAMLQLYDGAKNPCTIIIQSIKKLLKHQQSVFYSTVLVAILFISYRYVMNALFSFQLGVALYDVPLELISRCVPFLDIPSIVISLGGNSQMWGVLLVSFGYQLVLCVAYVFYIFYMICIHDEDISV